MKIIDLYSGSGGWTQAPRQRGHKVLSIDSNPKAYKDIEADILELEISDIPEDFREPDIILASPPCKAFSVAGSGSDPNTEGSGSERWEYRSEDNYHPHYGPRVPKDQVAIDGCNMVEKAIELIQELQPTYWWLENPRGGLRTMGFMRDIPGPVTVTYCRYGEERMKPTDLWGIWPETFQPRPKCKNGGYGSVEINGLTWRVGPDGFPCHHSATRGAKTGTQARQGPARYRIPFGLSWDVCMACEIDLHDIRGWRSLDRIPKGRNDTGMKDIKNQSEGSKQSDTITWSDLPQEAKDLSANHPKLSPKELLEKVKSQ